jgi:hypothetical protein
LRHSVTLRCPGRPAHGVCLWLTALAEPTSSRGSALTSAGSAWLAMASDGGPATASSRPVKAGVPVQARETLAPEKGRCLR